MRGLVLAPPVEVRPLAGGNTQLDFGPIAALDLLFRPYVMYWDRIDLPGNHFFKPQLSDDAEFLLVEGILLQTPPPPGPWTMRGSDAEAFFLQSQIDAFRLHEKESPGVWAMAQSADVLAAGPSHAPSSRGALVELYNALPVPSYDTPLPEILTFKQKRASELLALRSVLDDLYQDIVRSSDVPHSKTAAIGKIERALADLDAASRESFPKRLLSSLKVEVSVPSILATSALCADAMHQFGLSPLTGAAAGAIGAMIKFELGQRPRLAVSPQTAAFAYAYEAVRTFGIK